jgi:hypothetical protein
MEHTPIEVIVGKPNRLGWATVAFNPPIIDRDNDSMFGRPADAKGLAHCWNNFDAMLAALEAMRTAALNGNRGLSPALELTDAAIAAAKGE